MADNQEATAAWGGAIGRSESAPYDRGAVRAAGSALQGRGSDRSCDLLTMQGFQSSMASDDLPAPCKALSWEAGKSGGIFTGGNGSDWATFYLLSWASDRAHGCARQHERCPEVVYSTAFIVLSSRWCTHLLFLVIVCNPVLARCESQATQHRFPFIDSGRGGRTIARSLLVFARPPGLQPVTGRCSVPRRRRGSASDDFVSQRSSSRDATSRLRHSQQREARH